MKGFDEKTRFLIIGSLGTILAWLIYSIIHHIMPFEPRATLSWILSYFVAIAQQHSLHRRFTFFTTHEPFLPELLRAYFAYSIGFIVSTISHFSLTSINNTNHHVSWIISTIISVICNFIMLKFYVFHGTTEGEI